MSDNTRILRTSAPPSGSPLAAAFASLMGWAFDLFDLFLLLYVAGPVGHNIFPAESETLSLALVFTSFAVSIVMRPGGAAIFGNFADNAGRKKIMVVVLLGLGISTACMGLVPTYATVGVLAPILFLALRVVQGLFVGGVSSVTHTLGTESVPPRYRGMMSGLVGGGGAGLGAALASVTFIIVSQIFPGDAFNEVGWRFMFFTGLLGAVLSFFVLRKVEETPAFLEQQRKAKETGITSKVTFREMLRGRFAKITLLNIAVAAGAGAQYYLTSGFLPTYLDVVTPVPPSQRGWVLLVASLVVIISATVAGELSERFGRRITMLVIGVITIVTVPILLMVLARTDPSSLALVVLLSCVIAFLANAAYAPVMIFLNERYPTAIRSRGTAISWNTGFMLGGLLPTFVTLLSPTVDDIPSRLVIFVIGSGVVFLVSVLAAPETRGAMDATPEGDSSSTGADQPTATPTKETS